MTLALTAPTAWADLTQRQLRTAYSILLAAADPDAAKLLLLFRLNKVTVIGRQPSGAWLLKKGRDLYEVTAMQLAEALQTMDWLAQFPPAPVRPDTLAGRSTADPMLHDITFEDWLIIDNLYQAWLQTQDDERLDDMTEALTGRRKRLRPWERVAVFWWIASAKQALAGIYPDFLRPATAADGGALAPPSAARQTETQIRALTKGDLTKRAAILAAPMHEALAELDALAREYREFHQNTKK